MEMTTRNVYSWKGKIEREEMEVKQKLGLFFLVRKRMTGSNSGQSWLIKLASIAALEATAVIEVSSIGRIQLVCFEARLRALAAAGVFLTNCLPRRDVEAFLRSVALRSLGESSFHALSGR